MREGDYAALLDNLRHFGFDANFPILLYEGQILDGWNRYRACEELGIKHAEDFFVGTAEEAVDYVHRTNTRRNLTPNEHAELISRYYEDIKEAQGGDRKSDAEKSTGHFDPLIAEHENQQLIDSGSDVLNHELVYESDEFTQETERPSHPARKKAAHVYGVSESKVKRAAEYVKALDKLPEELKEKARAGKISQAEVIRMASGKPKPAPKPFEKKTMKRMIGAIAFEIEALADTFPETREACEQVLERCRKAQTYCGG